MAATSGPTTTNPIHLGTSNKPEMTRPNLNDNTGNEIAPNPSDGYDNDEENLKLFIKKKKKN